MGIDLGVKIEAGFPRKWISVKEMKKILNDLDDDDELYPNHVGNLSIFNHRKKEMIGWIEFSSESLQLIEDLDDD